MAFIPPKQDSAEQTSGSTSPATPAFPNGSRSSRRSWVKAMFLMRCPRCREGRLFKGLFRMNDPCSVCGLVHEREPGYFLGAMYFSYALAILVLVPLFFLFLSVLPTWPVLLVPLLPVLLYLPLTPLVYRYSRVFWIYFDRLGGAADRSSSKERAARHHPGDGFRNS
jgi:uncharacterized protein (DUF983 family)